MDQPKTLPANILKCGKRTYFFDVRAASNGNEYLKVTESQFVKEGEERRRNSFIFFKDDITRFIEIFNKLGKDLINTPKPNLSGNKKKE